MNLYLKGLPMKSEFRLKLNNVCAVPSLPWDNKRNEINYNQEFTFNIPLKLKL